MLEQFGWGRSIPTASGTLGLSSAWSGSWSNAWPNLKLVEINAHFLGKLGQAFSLEGFDGFGGDALSAFDEEDSKSVRPRSASNGEVVREVSVGDPSMER